MNKFCKTLVSLSLTLPLIATAADKPKNIIMVVGDGMGPAYTSAYRYFMDNPATDKVESTIFDQLLVGMASTYSAGTQREHTTKTYVTDSAASATALSTGVKTYNQAVALDVDDKKLQTLMEYAKSLDKTTGLVVTSQINHATPASYVAHDTYRYHYDAIAEKFFTNRVNGKFVADLMFGGGHRYFSREDNNIAKKFEDAGYQYYDNFAQLSSFNRLPALGLFADKGIGFNIDAKEKFRLRKMVKKALSLMEKSDNGYFLLIEGSMIDWCGHDNDIGCAMHEVDDLAKTLEYLKGYIDDRDDTLMVVTADHNTGGLSIGANGQYQWKNQLVKKIRHSVGFTSKFLLQAQPAKQVWQNYIGLKINQQQLAVLAGAQKVALKAIAEVKGAGSEKIKEVTKSQDSKLQETLAKVLAEVTLTGWTSDGHTGGDVQVFAHGHSKQMFGGHQDNTDIAKKLFTLLDK